MVKDTSCSIYDCISPVFYLSKIFGFAPFNLPSRGKKLKTSILDYLIISFCMSVYTFILISFVTHNYLVSQSDSLIFNIGGLIVILVSIVIAFLSVIIGFTVRNKIYEIFQKINDCDEDLISMGAALKYGFHSKVVWGYVSAHIIILLMAYPWSSQVLESRIFVDVTLVTAYFCESFVYFILMTQFQMLQASVKIRFTALNNMFW